MMILINLVDCVYVIGCPDMFDGPLQWQAKHNMASRACAYTQNHIFFLPIFEQLPDTHTIFFQQALGDVFNMAQSTFQLGFSIKIDILGNLTKLIATNLVIDIIARLGITTAHFFHQILILMVKASIKWNPVTTNTVQCFVCYWFDVGHYSNWLIYSETFQNVTRCPFY